MPNDTHDDIRALLAEAASDLPLPAPAPERTVRRARRRLISTVSVGALAAGLVLGGFLDLAHPFTRSVPATHPPLKHGTWVVDIDSGATTPLEGLPREAFWLTASRDGSLLAFSANVRGRSQVFVMEPSGTGLRRVTHDRYEASQPALSPDGSMLAYKGFGSEDVRNVFVMNLANARVQQLTLERKDVASLAWSPDGNSIVYSVPISLRSDVGASRPAFGFNGESFKLKKVDAISGRTTALVGWAHTPANFGTWSPDGLQIAYMRGEWLNGSYGFDPAEIWIMDADGTNAHRRISLKGQVVNLGWAPEGNLLAFSVVEGDGTAPTSSMSRPARPGGSPPGASRSGWMRTH